MGSPHLVGLEFKPELIAALASKIGLPVDLGNIQEIATGFNNKTFFLGDKHVIRFSRFSWPSYKIESEAASLIYANALLKGSGIAERLKAMVPLPIFWCSKVDPDFNCRWMILTRLPGKNLEQQWKTLSGEQQATVLEDLADAVACLKSRKFGSFGSFVFTEKGKTHLTETRVYDNNIEYSVLKENVLYENISSISQSEESITISSHWLGYGPCSSVSEIFHTLLGEAEKHREKVNSSKTQGCNLAPMEKYKPFILNLISQIEDLEKSSADRSSYLFSFTFVHGDLSMRNMLCDSDGKISGLLDFEWAGPDTFEKEWQESFDEDGNVDERPGTSKAEYKNSFYELVKQRGSPIHKDIPNFELLMAIRSCIACYAPWNFGISTEEYDITVLKNAVDELEGYVKSFS